MDTRPVLAPRVTLCHRFATCEMLHRSRLSRRVHAALTGHTRFGVEVWMKRQGQIMNGSKEEDKLKPKKNHCGKKSEKSVFYRDKKKKLFCFISNKWASVWRGQRQLILKTVYIYKCGDGNSPTAASAKKIQTRPKATFYKHFFWMYFKNFCASQASQGYRLKRLVLCFISSRRCCKKHVN